MVEHSVESLEDLLNKAKADLKAHHLDRLSVLLQAKAGELRELFQKHREGVMKQIINKLRSLKPLSAEEVDLVKKFIVGDAEYYTKIENDFEGWKQELHRLIGEYEKYGTSSSKLEDALILVGIIRDIRMLLPSIKFFLECAERVKRFEAMASDGVDLGEANILADLLERQLQSPSV